MSIASCIAFLRETRESAQRGQDLKAVTSTRELVALGRRHGHVFDADELVRVSSLLNGHGESDRHGESDGHGEPPRAPATAAPHHYEFDMADIPGFERVIGELPHLKIKPPSVDLDEFARGFRAEDMRSTSMSPADPGFRDWYERLMSAHQGDSAGPARRDFHLINLDEHVDHPGYARYFDAKRRTISCLEDFFHGEVRFSGSLWYPPASYRLWHTNETQPGWRMYIIDFDEPFCDPVNTSFFRYLNPQSQEIVTLREHPRMVRFFKVEQDPGKLFWHCITNPTTRHRWSFGFTVSEDWIDHFPGRH